jgi:hypothetical protein
LLSCTMKCKLHNCISFFIHIVHGTFLVNWRCFRDSIPRVFSYLQFLQSLSLLNLYFTSIYYRSIHKFYLHSKLDCSKKLVSVTKITGTVKGVTGYVIFNYAECHNRVVIMNAHATSILTCDRIASQNSWRISRPYIKKMSWLHDQQQYCLRCVPLRSLLIQKDWSWLQHVIFYWNWTFEGVIHINKHSHFTKVGKSQQRIKVLVQGESTTLSSQMVGKAISELMHREDATCDLIPRSPGQHDLLLPRVRSPQLPYLQGTRAAPALKTAANTGAPYNELHLVKCNELAECPLEFVTSSQDLVQCSLWQH